MSNFVRRLQRMGAGGNVIVDPIDPEEPLDGVRVYLTPDSGAYTVGQTLQIEVRMNAGDIEVNSYQMRFSYPEAQLQFDSVSTAGSAFSTTIAQEGGSGLVRTVGMLLGAGNTTSGDQLIATANFTIIGAGSAELVMDSDYTGVARASDSTPAEKQFYGASYSIAVA